MRKAGWIVSVLVVALAIAGYVLFSGERKVPIRYKTAPVERGPVVSVVTATGTINLVVLVKVGTMKSGMIQSLQAEFNAMGETTDVAAQMELAESQVKQAEATLNAAELDLKYTVIRSPVNGIVIARNVEVGQTVASSFATPNLFLVALDLTKMQVDTNVSESDIGGIAEGKEAAFSVDAYPGQLFQGRIRQVRNAPISVQNVVTYNVVIGVENRDLRLKPGMTANVAIIVARKDDVLKVPNAALRFTPPKSEHAVSGAAGANVAQSDPGSKSARPLLAGGNQAVLSKTVWKVGLSGDPEAVPVQPGISDGSVTEIMGGDLKEVDAVIVGIESSRADRHPQALPPGFGSGQRRSRDRGL